jgi:hypothetical protein
MAEFRAQLAQEKSTKAAKKTADIASVATLENTAQQFVQGTYTL